MVNPTDVNYYLFQVKMPPAGYRAELLVQQASGTNVAFKVDVLNSACGQTPGSLQPSAFPAGGVWQMARVIAQQSGTAGAQVGDFTPFGQPFRNQDGPDSDDLGRTLSS
ncbi:MAG TPA: hypothetical protein VH682_13130 [Gemmataceae bacterium]